jgi:chitinase
VNRPPVARAQAFSYNVIAYFTDWGIYGRNYQVADIPVSKVTHIFYAFAKPNADGSVVLGDSYSAIDKAFPGDSWDTAKQPYRGNFWQFKLLK